MERRICRFSLVHIFCAFFVFLFGTSQTPSQQMKLSPPPKKKSNKNNNNNNKTLMAWGTVIFLVNHFYVTRNKSEMEFALRLTLPLAISFFFLSSFSRRLSAFISCPFRKIILPPQKRPLLSIWLSVQGYASKYITVQRLDKKKMAGAMFFLFYLFNFFLL